MKCAQCLALWIEQMHEAEGDACSYVDGLDSLS